MRKLTCDRMTALASAMVLAGLLAGTVGARADELSDLRGSDQLLQQKLDLLDHEQDKPDAPLPPDADKGSFPRSVQVPGTSVSIRVFGSATETLKYSR